MFNGQNFAAGKSYRLTVSGSPKSDTEAAAPNGDLHLLVSFTPQHDTFDAHVIDVAEGVDAYPPLTGATSCQASGSGSFGTVECSTQKPGYATASYSGEQFEDSVTYALYGNKQLVMTGHSTNGSLYLHGLFRTNHGPASLQLKRGSTLVDSFDTAVPIDCGPSIHVQLSAPSVAAGGVEHATASGLDPGERISAVLHSDARPIGTFTANNNGVATFDVDVPTTFTGSHTVSVTSLANGSYGSATFRVAEATSGPTSTTPVPGSTSTGPGLAQTGSAANATLTYVGLLLLSGGAAAAYLGRRRRGLHTR